MARLRGEWDAARKRLAVVTQRHLAHGAQAVMDWASGRADEVPVESAIRDDLSLDGAKLLPRRWAAEGGIAVVGLRGPRRGGR